MLIKEKTGNLKDMEIGSRELDALSIEWHESNKRILHKTTVAKREVTLKFLKENSILLQDDVIYEDENYLIVVDIQPCEVIVIQPATMYDMAKLCYEIGNKHLPLFYEEEAVLIPFDAPLFKWLTATGFEPVKQHRKLIHQLKTTVSSHAHAGNSSSLFSKILKLTSPAND
ncbi:MAG TPA: urease accessory protein UreE [Flavisolibacter sp.]|nr:urease accessory protein UreE [Flavisolibacter sp.]